MAHEAFLKELTHHDTRFFVDFWGGFMDTGSMSDVPTYGGELPIVTDNAVELLTRCPSLTKIHVSELHLLGDKFLGHHAAGRLTDGRYLFITIFDNDMEVAIAPHCGYPLDVAWYNEEQYNTLGYIQRATKNKIPKECGPGSILYIVPYQGEYTLLDMLKMLPFA
jgi:hypothetical protein